MNERPEDEPDDIELLLPWRATGRLAPADARRVDDALARDARLRTSYAAIAEDMAAAVAANDETPAPGLRSRDRLAQLIDAHDARRPSRFFAGVFGRLRVGLSPRAIALVGAAAAVVILAQAAALTDLLVRPPGATYRTASATAAPTGATVLVQFQSAAKLSDVAASLERDGFTLVDGPKPGGLWTVRIGPADMPQAKIDAAIAILRAQPNLATLVLPGAKK